MPRQARIDAPGAFQHIICCGLERRNIFRDDADRNNLAPLIQTGTSPIATVMERLLTGYAGDFNRRHNRHGHLFQNRYVGKRPELTGGGLCTQCRRMAKDTAGSQVW